MTADRKPDTPSPPRRGRPDSDPISMGLRRLWANVESEDVPDDFFTLLDEIDNRRGDVEAGPDAGGETAGEGAGSDNQERP